MKGLLIHHDGFLVLLQTLLRENYNLIDEHARLILWQTGPICVLNSGFAPVGRLHDKHMNVVPRSTRNTNSKAEN